MKIISRQEAKALGLTRYFTGKPCKYGHLEERGTKCANCLKCTFIHNKIQYYRDKEKSKARTREYRHNNVDKVRETAKKWRFKNRERCKEKLRLYHGKRAAAMKALRELGIQF